MLNNDFFYITESDFSDPAPLARIALNPEHEIYKAHFPGEPITPGVCQIQIVSELLSLCLNAKTFLTDIKNVKYLSVISPLRTTALTVIFKKMELAEETCSISAQIEGDGRIFSKLSMTFHVVRNSSDI